MFQCLLGLTHEILNNGSRVVKAIYKSVLPDGVLRATENTNAAHDFITSYSQWRMNYGAHCVAEATTSSLFATELLCTRGRTMSGIRIMCSTSLVPTVSLRRILVHDLLLKYYVEP